MILISLITSLETYLEGSFRALATKKLVSELNMEIFINFLNEFYIKSEYFKVLRQHNNHVFLISELLPSRMDFQQKGRAKVAYKLFDIDLRTIADERQNIWQSIFRDNNGYIALRHGIIHAGIFNSVNNILAKNTIVEENLICKASLDIAKFVFELDKSISIKFPESDYPDFYGLIVW